MNDERLGAPEDLCEGLREGLREGTGLIPISAEKVKYSENVCKKAKNAIPIGAEAAVEIPQIDRHGEIKQTLDKHLSMLITHICLILFGDDNRAYHGIVTAALHDALYRYVEDCTKELLEQEKVKR